MKSMMAAVDNCARGRTVQPLNLKVQVWCFWFAASATTRDRRSDNPGQDNESS
jgi:hypothetical protein